MAGDPNVNAVDIGIIIILAIGVFAGFRQGLILEVGMIVGAVIGLIVAQLEYSTLRDLLVKIAPQSPWLTTVSYLLIFVVVWGVILILARKIRFIIRLLLLGGVDRLGGAVLGFLLGILVVEVLTYFGRRAHNSALHHAIVHSRLASVFEQAIPFVDKLLPHIHY